MSTSRVFVIAVMFVFAAHLAVAAPPGREAKAAAQAMVDRFVDSWNKADGAEYGENYWPDAELVDPSGTVISGRDAIVQEHVDLWKSIFKGTRQKCTIRRVELLSPRYLLVDFDPELSGVKAPPPGAALGPDGVIRAHLKHILEKRNGVWKVRWAQNTIVAAAPK